MTAHNGPDTPPPSGDKVQAQRHESAAQGADEGPPQWALDMVEALVDDPRIKAAALVRVTRDTPHARHYAEERDTVDYIYEQLQSDIAMVLTVYDEHVAADDRGPWRDRLAKFVDYEPEGEAATLGAVADG